MARPACACSIIALYFVAATGMRPGAWSVCQGLQPPFNPLGPESSTPARQGVAGGSPLHFIIFPVTLQSDRGQAPLSCRTMRGARPQDLAGSVKPCSYSAMEAALVSCSEAAFVSCNQPDCSATRSMAFVKWALSVSQIVEHCEAEQAVG